MAPKLSPLEAIRKIVAAEKKLAGTGPKDSAYNKLINSNKEFSHGKRPETEDDGEEDDDGDNIKVVPMPKKQKVAKKKTVAKPTPKEPAKEEEPTIEHWRPAGGDYVFQNADTEDGELTSTLGVARIPTWTLETFTASLKKLIEEHGPFQEVLTKEFVHGGESLTDVFVKFRSDLIADTVKESIDQAMVEGRKLQVHFV